MMPRKNGKTLSESREQVRRRYLRGSLVAKAVRGERAFSEVELAMAKETACILTASNFSEQYIAECLGTTRGVVNGWFKNDEEMAKRVLQVKEDIVTGALDLLRGYMIEAVEMLMQIARETTDDAVAAKVLQDLLDRGGLSKVNKSESVSAQTIKNSNEVDVVDKTGILEALKDASPEAQFAAAEHLDRFLATVAEHTEEEVTHGRS